MGILRNQPDWQNSRNVLKLPSTQRVESTVGKRKVLGVPSGGYGLPWRFFSQRIVASRRGRPYLGQSRTSKKPGVPPSTAAYSAIPNPEVIKINSLCDIPNKVEDYYMKGYVISTVHPVILSIGRRKHLPVSFLYRVVLSRLKSSQKNTQSQRLRRPRLSFEEWPFTCETLTIEFMKGLLEKVNEASKRGRKFVGFLTRPVSLFKPTNGTRYMDAEDVFEAKHKRKVEQMKDEGDENYKNWMEGTLSGQSSESGIEEESQEETRNFHEARPQSGRESSLSRSQKGEDTTLYAVFNIYDDDSAGWTYHEGSLSMKVTRKGTTVSNMEADWLDLTTSYYKQGWSLIDSLVPWEVHQGDHLSKSLDGLFIYEEEGCGSPGSNRKGNDAIVVEQWTVIEGCEVKTDYGPLLHTLADFGWLLTCVVPTPIIRHDSEGNLATKQVVFLQRPVMFNSTVQTAEKKPAKHTGGEEKSKASNRNVGSHTISSRTPERPSSDEVRMAPSRQCWAKEEPTQYGHFSGFSCNDSVLRELDDGQFEQEDGVTQVTCM
ncbi:raftlin-2 isoform X2 [Pleurodeles waltl]|uniref:raftlin-2 isoform X2 n=1 Tax=Pleurodeles waltl TaxID=8319 RepID=UPI003709C39F